MLFDRYTSLSCIIVVLLFVLGVSITEGQEIAGSFEQLQPRASVGDHVTVTDVTGREVRGTITQLSFSSLTLLVGQSKTDFFEAEVETISVRDSRWNGTVWGLGVGGVLGAWVDRGLVKEYGREDISVGESVKFIAGAAGVGAGIGFGVDAMIRGRRLIYSRAQKSIQGNTTVLPTWGSRRKAIFVLLRF
jgi:hypothetical protein